MRCCYIPPFSDLATALCCHPRAHQDDCIDSGTGQGGYLVIEDCYIERCFHEGVALSAQLGAPKHVVVKSSLVAHCQQGVELGFGPPELVVQVVNCTFHDNDVAIRYNPSAMRGQGRAHWYVLNACPPPAL